MNDTTSLYPHMLQEYYVSRVRKLSAARDARLAAVNTRGDAMKLQAHIRRTLQRCFAPWPRRTPLNARVTGTIRRKRYTIEHIVMESRPGYFVTGCLYIPAGNGRFPAVLAACGHAEEGKAAPVYQRFARGLAELGYVVFHYDPVGQGERDQFLHLPKRDRVNSCVRQHIIMGNKLALVGEFLGSWRVWDGIRALDFLLTRPEVDRARVGMTGNSGGGTVTTFINAFERRFTMAAPSCFVTSFLNNLENELPADSEQNPPGFLAEGLDLGDFIIAAAPRPTILIGQHHDFFDERGLRKTYEQVKRIYRLLGAADRLELHIGPGTHGYQLDGRMAMYRFFNQIAGLKPPGRESTAPVEELTVINAAAPHGHVGRLKGSKTIHDLIAARTDVLAKQRPKHTDASLAKAITGLLNLPPRHGVPHYRVVRPVPTNRCKPYDVCSAFPLETEAGIQSVLYVWERGEPTLRGQPPTVPDAVLYLPHLSSEADVTGGQSPHLPKVLHSLDPRGIGRSKALTCDWGHPALCDADFFHASHGLMLDESYLGRQVHDVLATLDLLGSRGTRHVHLIGRGVGSIIATFTACLHPLVNRVTLKNTLTSFERISCSPNYTWPFAALPANALKHLDLPDCHRVLRGKRLRLVDPWNEQMKPAR